MLPIMVINLIAGAFEYRDPAPARTSLTAPVFERPSAGPAFAPGQGPGYVSLWGSRPYSLDELSSKSVITGRDGSGYALRLAWERFGMDEYYEDTFDLSAAIRPLHYLSWETAVSHYRMVFNTDGPAGALNITDVTLSMAAGPFSGFTAGVRQENIFALFNKTRRDFVDPRSSASLSWEMARGITIGYRLEKTRFAWTGTASLSANIMEQFSMTLGYARETMTYFSSFTCVYENMSVTYGYRFHRHLGSTHTVGLTASLVNTGFRAMTFSSVFKKERQGPRAPKININRCSGDEIRSIPFLDETHARRIIRFREIMGPVTVTALHQMGMEKDEIDSLMEYTYGYQEEKKTGPMEKNNGGTHQKRMSIFKKLIGTGLSAGDASDLSGLAAAGQWKKLYARIETLRGYTAEQKAGIRAICASQR